ncbi:hypothetical protein [Moosepox virus GoldyGopher14]|nr:hypothetical protein [Moosepox virus GoldyGopher14]
MFVENDTLIIYKNWPYCLINTDNKYIPFPNSNSYTFNDDKIKISNSFKKILLINPSYISLLMICVYIKRNSWKGNILILFTRNKPPPFRLVNDN